MLDPFAHIKHPLIRDGLSQQDRQNDNLKPASAPIDDRSLSGLLQYMYEYARQLNYYKEDDKLRAGDWVVFFQRSIPFQYALIGRFDLEQLEKRSNDIQKHIDRRLSFNSLNPFFDLIFDLSNHLEQWLISLDGDRSGLKAAIESLIETNLAAQMKKLLGLANAAGKWGYSYSKKPKSLSNYWGIGLSDIIAVDTAITSLKGSQKYKILESKKILSALYRTFWKGIQAIVNLARDEKQLEKSLFNENAQNHGPHLGLLFSFLLLFKELQGNLNELSEKHLKFFYSDILRLKKLPFQPDKANLIFELGNKVEENIALKKGLRLKAGKEDNGTDILFELEDELILTKTKISSLKTLFIEQGKSREFIPDSLSHVYVAPIANSADGLGEGFPKEQPKSWKTVGNRQSKWINPDTNQIVNYPLAKLGLVFSSKVLFLREGFRSIKIHLELEAHECFPDEGINAFFDVYLSTEEGWTLVPYLDGQNAAEGEVLPQIPFEVAISSNSMILNIAVANDFLPIIYPGQDVITTDFGNQQPMVKLVLNQKKNDASAYYWLRLLKIKNIKIDVCVLDVRNLVIQNDLSVLDPNKPFQPFGPFPKKNSSNFLIGNEEIFCKNWQRLKVNILWKDKPDFGDHYSNYRDDDNKPSGDGNFKVNIDLLSAQNWINATGCGDDDTSIDFCLFLDNPKDGSKDVCNEKGSASVEKIGIADFNTQGLVISQMPETGLNQYIPLGDFMLPMTLTSLGNAVNQPICTMVESKWFGGRKPCPVPSSIVNGYTNDLECGFIRFKLGDRDFLHDKYQQELTACILKIAENMEAAAQLEAVNVANDINRIDDEVKSIKSNIDNIETDVSNIKLDVENLKDDIDDLQSDPNLTLNISGGGFNLETTGGTTDEIASSFNTLKTADPESLPLPPYTPLIETISLDYSATASSNPEEGIEEVTFSHLYPWENTYENFGFKIKPSHSKNAPTVLPCFIAEGQLFVGLENYTPGDAVQLFFQMEPSTADPDLDKAVVCWEYLRNNEWKSLKPDINILSDGTNGLIQSGIINIAVPQDISKKHTTILPGQFHWLKGSVLLRTPAIAETIDVYTQAVQAKFVDTQSSNFSRLEQPLIAGSIAKLESPQAGVKGLSQLYESFGGRAPEDASVFNRRVSEYLKHKGRAMSLSDYEHLILEAFPEVYKVKCITHTLGRRGEYCDYELCPGFVTIVVVPDLAKLNAADIFQPKVPAATLQAIKTFLSSRISPFIKLEVLNPIYEEVKVTATVQFVKGKSVNFYIEQLDKDIQSFLSPWIESPYRADISFGGQIYYSLVLDFIEHRPYVEFVIDLVIEKEEIANDDNTELPKSKCPKRKKKEDTSKVEAEGSRTVLTSSKKHSLAIVTDQDLVQAKIRSRKRGIGFEPIPSKTIKNK